MLDAQIVNLKRRLQLWEGCKHVRNMYETDSRNDGYKALKLFVTKLNPKCTSFFQYPRRNWSESDQVWYEARPVGENKLGNMMKEISKAASLSRIYTNHSVRATAITIWSNAGVANRHIMAISGHRSEQSLSHCNSRPSTSQLLDCSEVVSKAMEADSRPEPCSSSEEIIQSSSLKPKPLDVSTSMFNYLVSMVCSTRVKLRTCR
jgi:hypothetical protein